MQSSVSCHCCNSGCFSPKDVFWNSLFPGQAPPRLKSSECPGKGRSLSAAPKAPSGLICLTLFCLCFLLQIKKTLRKLIYKAPLSHHYILLAVQRPAVNACLPNPPIDTVTARSTFFYPFFPTPSGFLLTSVTGLVFLQPSRDTFLRKTGQIHQDLMLCPVESCARDSA